jgi:DNA-binding NarL/FixJ family response regulator
MVRIAIAREPDMDLVGEAVNGREAVELVQNQEIDVLILDLYMPEMDGLEALPLIKKASPATKVIVLSGMDASAMRPTALAAGADLYLEKGVSIPEIVSSVRSSATS